MVYIAICEQIITWRDFPCLSHGFTGLLIFFLLGTFLHFFTFLSAFTFCATNTWKVLKILSLSVQLFFTKYCSYEMFKFCIFFITANEGNLNDFLGFRHSLNWIKFNYDSETFAIDYNVTACTFNERCLLKDTVSMEFFHWKELIFRQ